jgi:uncharacterized protein YrzB (UPF0473 family)
MLIKFKIKNIDKNFVYLKNQENEELKIKKENLSSDIEINNEIKIKLFQKEDENEKNLSKEILNEILNNNDHK